MEAYPALIINCFSGFKQNLVSLFSGHTLGAKARSVRFGKPYWHSVVRRAMTTNQHTLWAQL